MNVLVYKILYQAAPAAKISDGRDPSSDHGWGNAEKLHRSPRPRRLLCWCPGPDSNRYGVASEGFSYSLQLSLLSRALASSFGVWTFSLPCPAAARPASVRQGPSSLYTFPCSAQASPMHVDGLARDCSHATRACWFPEFDPIHTGRFRAGCSICLSPLRLPISPPGQRVRPNCKPRWRTWARCCRVVDDAWIATAGCRARLLTLRRSLARSHVQEPCTATSVRSGLQPQPQLDVRALHLWRGEKHLLRGVSLRPARGELLQVVGPNGVGKTSLLRCVAGLLPIESGEIIWSGQPLDGCATTFISSSRTSRTSTRSSRISRRSRICATRSALRRASQTTELLRDAGAAADRACAELAGARVVGGAEAARRDRAHPADAGAAVDSR